MTAKAQAGMYGIGPQSKSDNDFARRMRQASELVPGLCAQGSVWNWARASGRVLRMGTC